MKVRISQDVTVTYGDLSTTVPARGEGVLDVLRDAYAWLALEPSVWTWQLGYLDDGGARVEAQYDPRDGVGRVHVRVGLYQSREYTVFGALEDVLKRAQEEVNRQAEYIF